VTIRPANDRPGKLEMVVGLRLHTDSGPTAELRFLADLPAAKG